MDERVRFIARLLDGEKMAALEKLAPGEVSARFRRHWQGKGVTRNG